MAAIAPIPTLPVFFKLRGRRVLLAGGSAPAVWKAELLAAAGAAVLVCDPAPCAEMEDLAVRVSIAVERRTWRREDFAEAAMAIGALEGEDAEAFRAAARAAGVPVNVVDVPHLCDFQFGTILDRSPLLIAISTDGAAPVFGQALRTRIEALLPDTIGAWAQAAKDWRPDIQALGLGFAARRRYWEAFTDRALGGAGRMPDESDRAACLAAARDAAAARLGRLLFVGVGPGEPDLVTLRAVRALQSADIILHEAGLDPALLGLGRREAARIDERAVSDLAAWLEGGKTVAWAAPGDPRVCLRWQARRRDLPESREPADMVGGLACATCVAGCPAETPARQDQ